MGAAVLFPQVALFANTGILITPHGAAMANMIFMPVHSVVIEVRAK